MKYRFEILGPATIVSDGEDAVLPSTKPSAILVCLLIKCNSFVSLEYLKYALWGEHPPPNADVTLPTYILRLRRLLRKYDSEADPINTMSRGYRITFPPNSDSLDLLMFQRLLDKATHYRSSGALENERSALQRAEKLWKGPALSNIPSDMLHREETPRLNDQWFDVLERRFTIDLSLGDIDGLAPQIRQAITHRPERERYWEQLIETLHRIGRTTEALNEYRKVHAYLTSELGIEPRASLQRLHLEVLRQAELSPGREPLAFERSAPVRGVRPGPPSGVSGEEPPGGPKAYKAVPYLPLSQDFVGRSPITESLVDEIKGSDIPIAVISGPPAAGKTEIAFQAARQCTDEFAGGVHIAQLLRPDGVPWEREEVLHELLLQAGAEPPAQESLPTDAEERQARLLRSWRSTLADRPCLIVVDGAKNSADCLPFLPRSPESRVVVTSRSTLPRLIAFHGARTHVVPPLSRYHSVQLLTRILGDEAEGKCHEVLQRICDVCGGLPGALRLAGAKYLSTPHLTLAQFATLLEASPLDQLSAASESEFSLREQLYRCYEDMSETARRIFLELTSSNQQGLPVTDLFASFSGTPNEFDQALAELYNASLIHHYGAGRIGVLRLLKDIATHRVDRLTEALVSNEK